MTAPFISSPMQIEPQWIDYNGHLNMAYYNVLFDRCGDEAYAQLGIGPDYAASRGLTTYIAQFHVSYLRELHQGDEVRIGFHLLDHDDRMFHFHQEIRHSDGWLAATGEGLTLHVDMSGPKVAPFPPDIAARVAAMRAAHADLAVPESVGRTIGIRRRAQ